MTTPDPSREAFEKWRVQERRNRIPEFQKWPDDVLMVMLNCEPEREWKIWQATMAHKGAELEQAHEARRQAQAELADIQEKRNRIGLDIDRALRGEVNEQSPIAGRLKLIAADAEEKLAAIPADAITVNLVRHAGLDKHVARECEQIVRTLVGAKLWLPEVIERAKAEASEFDHWFDAAPKQEGST